MTKDIGNDLKVPCLIIKEEFLKKPSLMTQAKVSFRCKIKSNRKMEKVKSIDDLLVLLRRHGLLKCDSFDTLEVFKNLLQCDRFDKAVDNHRSSQNFSSTKFNVYADQRSHQHYNGSRQADHSSQNFIPGGKREKMFNILANGVSQEEFFSLARILKFSENEISGFVKRVNSDSDRTTLMFGMYEERKGELSVELVLILLDLIKRHDLAELIRNL